MTPKLTFKTLGVADDGVSRRRFLQLARESIEFCDDETNAAFDLITGLGGSNPEVIEDSDIDTLVDLFEALSGTSMFASLQYLHKRFLKM